MEIVTDGEEPAEMIQVEGMLGWVASAWKLPREMVISWEREGGHWRIGLKAPGGTAEGLIGWEGLGQVPRNPWKLGLP